MIGTYGPQAKLICLISVCWQLQLVWKVICTLYHCSIKSNVTYEKCTSNVCKLRNTYSSNSRCERKLRRIFSLCFVIRKQRKLHFLSFWWWCEENIFSHSIISYYKCIFFLLFASVNPTTRYYVRSKILKLIS